MKYLKNNKGFTLMELLIVSAILVMVVGVSSLLLLTGLRNYSDNAERINGQYNVRMSLVQLNRDLRTADSADVSIGAGGKSIAIGTKAYSYDGTAGTLTYSDGINDPRIVGSSLTAFSVSKVDDTVHINIKAKWNDSDIHTKVALKSIPRPTPTP